MSDKKQKRDSHESLCRKCSECCRVRIIWNGQGVLLDIYCPALNQETKLCRIYPWRHDNLAFVLMGGHPCLSTDQALSLRYLPDDCPYVLEEGYKGTRFDEGRLAEFRQKHLYDYMEIVRETRKHRDAIDSVLKLMKKK